MIEGIFLFTIRYSTSTRAVVLFFDGKIKDNTYIEISETMSPGNIGFSFSTLRPKIENEVCSSKTTTSDAKISETIVPTADDFFQYSPKIYGKKEPAARRVKENINRFMIFPVLLNAIIHARNPIIIIVR